LELVDKAGGLDSIDDRLALKWALAESSRAGAPVRGSRLPAVVAPATVLRKALIVRAFLRTVRTDWTTETPLDAVIARLRRAPPASKRPTETLEAAEVRRLLDTPSAKSRTGIRCRAFLALLFGGGLRLSEATGLRLSDVRTEHGVDVIRLRRAKSGSAKQVLPKWAAARVAALVALRRRDGAGGDDWLFPGRDPGRKINDRNARQLFKRLLIEAELDPVRYSPHSARATAITRLLTSGADYGDVKSFARHRSFSMVEAYDRRRKALASAAGLRLKY
jgi:integrase